MIEIDLDIDRGRFLDLRTGDEVLLTGTVYTARDAAHAKIAEALRGGGEPPFPLKGAVIFYAGPVPKRPDASTAAVGPTTSYRMDPFTPGLLAAGVRATIGKGRRSAAVADACRENGAVYLIAVGGIAALLSKRVKKIEVFAYPELGPEAVHRLVFDRFPCIVAVDSEGNDIYGI